MNQPPQIESVTVSTNRTEVDTSVTVTATVRDPETPIEQLGFEWLADAGAFSGQGPSVTWTVPKGAPTPNDYAVTVTVTETYGPANAQGVRSSNVVKASSSAVRVHDSPRELSELSMRFLSDFANSAVPASTAVKEFTDSCGGKAEERIDIEENRIKFEILSSSLSMKNVSVSSDRQRAQHDRRVHVHVQTRQVSSRRPSVVPRRGCRHGHRGLPADRALRAEPMVAVHERFRRTGDRIAPRVLRPAMTARAVALSAAVLSVLACGQRPATDAKPPAARHLQIDGTLFRAPGGSVFQWRGITAFRLLDYIADKREPEVERYLAWAAGKGLTVVRVLAMGGGFMDLRPRDGRAALPRLLEMAARHAVHVEVVALAGTRDMPLDLEEQIRRARADCRDTRQRPARTGKRAGPSDAGPPGSRSGRASRPGGARAGRRARGPGFD